MDSNFDYIFGTYFSDLLIMSDNRWERQFYFIKGYAFYLYIASITPIIPCNINYTL